MSERLFKFFFKKKQKNNCIQVLRPECSENKYIVVKQKVQIDFNERGKFYSALFSRENCL